MEFPGSAPTVGIEWEVALVDPVTRDLVAKAPEIMAELDRRYPGHTITREFLANTLEMVTGVHGTIPDAVEDLRGYVLLPGLVDPHVHLDKVGTAVRGCAGLREAMADERTGPQLERLLRGLERSGLEIAGDRLKTSPRGWPADHPRIDLLRHRSLVARHDLGFEPVIHTGRLLDLVREDWRATRPLVEWLRAHGRVGRDG